jgi:hypothetical protein
MEERRLTQFIIAILYITVKRKVKVNIYLYFILFVKKFSFLLAVRPIKFTFKNKKWRKL